MRPRWTFRIFRNGLSISHPRNHLKDACKVDFQSKNEHTCELHIIWKGSKRRRAEELEQNMKSTHKFARKDLNIARYQMKIQYNTKVNTEGYRSVICCGYTARSEEKVSRITSVQLWGFLEEDQRNGLFYWIRRIPRINPKEVYSNYLPKQQSSSAILWFIRSVGRLEE